MTTKRDIKVKAYFFDKFRGNVHDSCEICGKEGNGKFVFYEIALDEDGAVNIIMCSQCFKEIVEAV